MTKKKTATTRKTDRRVQRTRHLLADALVELMHEKPFKAITVQDVLARAHVGRSTFYTHYSDKDDLFLSDVDHFFAGAATMLARSGDTSRRVAPVREFFEHIAEAREFYAALVAAGKIHDVRELAQGNFARAIEQRLAALPPAGALAAAPRAAVANALAGALLSMLSWWIDHDMPTPPAQMDDIFHHLVWSGVGVATEQQDSPAAQKL